MEFLRDIVRRILMVAVFAVFFAAGWYLLDTVRQEPVSLAELQKTVDVQRQVCRRLHDQIRQKYAELAAIPFCRADLKVVKHAEIRSCEVLYDEAQREFRTAREALENARSGMVEKSDVFRTKYLIAALMTGIFTLILLPVLAKILMYYLAAPLVVKLPPVRLADECGSEQKIVFFPGATALDMELPCGTPLFLRSGDWGKKRTGVTARTRLMWSWRYPLVTFSAGLCELVEMIPESGKRAVVTITSPTPDVFVARVDLNGGSVVIRPRFLAGFAGDVQIRTRWSFHLHNLLSGRVRHIILGGTGTLFVTGSWGVDAARPEEGQDWRIEDDLLFGYSTDAEYALCRTETFWHYFRGKATLFDRRMKKGIFFTQHNRMEPGKTAGTFLERTVNALLNGIGGLLGF